MRTSLIACLLAGLLTHGAGQAAPVLQAVPSISTTTVGTHFSVELQISGMTDFATPSLGIYDISLSFDPTLVELGTVAFGAGLDLFGLGTLQSTTVSAGTINLFELSFDSADELNALQPDKFVLATLEFSAIALGANPFDLTLAFTGDADGNLLDIGKVDGL